MTDPTILRRAHAALSIARELADAADRAGYTAGKDQSAEVKAARLTHLQAYSAHELATLLGQPPITTPWEQIAAHTYRRDHRGYGVVVSGGPGDPWTYDVLDLDLGWEASTAALAMAAADDALAAFDAECRAELDRRADGLPSPRACP